MRLSGLACNGPLVGFNRLPRSAGLRPVSRVGQRGAAVTARFFWGCY